MLESFSFKETLTCFMVLFAVIDIVGSVSMIFFFFLVKEMLKFIGIDLNSFSIARALVIFIIALEMILGIEIHKVENVKAASIVPIAFPLVAGAGTLTTTLSLRAEFHVVNIIVGIILNTILVYI